MRSMGVRHSCSASVLCVVSTPLKEIAVEKRKFVVSVTHTSLDLNVFGVSGSLNQGARVNSEEKMQSSAGLVRDIRSFQKASCEQKAVVCLSLAQTFLVAAEGRR